VKSVSSINIKEQKKVEEGLRLLSQYAQDAIIQMNSNGLVTYWNKSAERLFGYTEKEMIGKNLHSIIVPERYHKAHKIGFSKFKKSGQGAAINKTLELEGIRKDGTEFPVELSLSAVRVKGEWNSIGIIRDITKRKKIEQKLRDSEEKLQTLFDNINDAIYILDLKGNFINVNDTACKRLGYEKRAFLQMHIRDINEPGLIAENPQLVDEKLWLGKDIVETVHVTKSGKKIPVEIYSK
jgi:PAS domain S-box-containing protein